MIEIKNLCKTYISKTSTLDAVKNVSLKIEDGDIYGIIGLSGAGKSSLVRCINMLEKPTSGEILINEKDITKLNPKELRETRKKIGMIFQNFNLLMNSTVYENIAFPLKISGLKKTEIDKKVKELLEVVDLFDKKDVYPSQLSGGQKQRVGIARALANDPKIILCDEATSALDPNTTQSILNLLKSINKRFSITIIVITHEMNVIKNICNKVAVMENGQIVEAGSVIEVFSNPKTETLKSFLEDDILYVPKEILIKNKEIYENVLKISFLGNRSEEPIISNMVKKHDVDVNILAGNIENIQDTNLGHLVVKISGQEKDVLSSIKYLNMNNLKVEVI
ncbi:methionine ABC transporter ATP-binding protein [Clostridium sediminicola]|uniref:methionine ABC transporter ATP-binding protein n=1 Tax=Clostridium sediminicola TaxID=3114879 RepID=UPI0031F25DB3